MNAHCLHRMSPRVWRAALPLLLALACSACVAYPAYDTGYGSGYANYGYASSYGWGLQPVFSGSYLYRSTYVNRPSVIYHRQRGSRRAYLSQTGSQTGSRTGRRRETHRRHHAGTLHRTHHATGSHRGWHGSRHRDIRAGAARHSHTGTRHAGTRRSAHRSGHHRR